MTTKNNERGFFGLTARVCAVVIHKRVTEDGQIKSSWEAYPTNSGGKGKTVFSELSDGKHTAYNNYEKNRENAKNRSQLRKLG